MLKPSVQDSKTFLRPQLQLFAEPASKEDPNKNPNNHTPPPADPPTDGVSSLPKTQEELDALINTRLKCAKKDWPKEQKQAQQPPAAPPATPPAEGVPPAEDNSASLQLQREIVETRAQLAAYKEGIKPEAVEDAVLLAMHDAEKAGDELDEDAVAEALKEVLKRHPEWKKQDDPKNSSGGFRVGASENDNHPKTDDDVLAAIFGNNIK